MGKTMVMRALDANVVPYTYHKHARKQHTAAGVAEDLGIPVAWVVKAMIVKRGSPPSSKRDFALVVVPGDRKLSLKKVAEALGEKDVAMASERDVQRVTGFQVGAVSVVGLRRKDIVAFVDQGVLALEQALISSGRPDAGLALTPQDLLRAMEGAQVGDFSTGA
jgi:Cys-tRNA(Pro)/Cys-tRNA(Cys) deacylase